MFRPVWILPRRCTSNVRSLTSTTLAPRTAWTVEITWPRCSVLVHSTVISRSVVSPRASTASTATIWPPWRLMAAVTLPRVPPLRGTSTRMVSENWAEGVATSLRLREASRRPASKAPRPLVRSKRAARRQPRAVPDRREQPRLPRLLRPARDDLHVQGAADQRDLRLRLDAREDRLRVRGEADAGRLGR